MSRYKGSRPAAPAWPRHWSVIICFPSLLLLMSGRILNPPMLNYISPLKVHARSPSATLSITDRHTHTALGPLTPPTFLFDSCQLVSEFFAHAGGRFAPRKEGNSPGPHLTQCLQKRESWCSENNSCRPQNLSNSSCADPTSPLPTSFMMLSLQLYPVRSGSECSPRAVQPAPFHCDPTVVQLNLGFNTPCELAKEPTC